jgi:asparagine N-glycosylation enzyme membrane subunit Stt3
MPSKKQKIILVVSAVALPVGVFALDCKTPLAALTDLTSIVCLILQIINPIVGILMTLSLLTFFWGIVKYIGAGGDEEKLEDGRRVLIYGVIAIFVIVSVWGLVKFIKITLGI